MAAKNIPTSGQLKLRVGIYGGLIAIPALVVVLLYVHVLLHLNAREWTQFVWAFLPAGILAGGWSELWRRKAIEPVATWLDACQEGNETEEQALDAFSAVMRFPEGFMRVVTIAWVGAATSAPLVMTIFGSEGWGLGYRSLVVLVSALTGAFASAVALFFLLKRYLEPLRSAIATAITDPQLREARVKAIPLAMKMQVAMVGTVASLLIFAAVLSHGRAGMAIDQTALDWESQMLNALAPIVVDGTIEEALEELITTPELLAYPTEFAFLDLDSPFFREGESLVVGKFMLEEIGEGQSTGQKGHLHQEYVWAWKELSDRRVITARISRDDLRGTFSTLKPLLVGVVGVSIGMAWLVSMLLSGDVRRSTVALRAAAERMADGDLQRGEVLESEDELGSLWRSFETMGDSLRQTVKSLSVAADRVDNAASEIAAVADDVAGASADQVRRIQQANELMVSINDQVMDVSNSAQALNVSVEESSSSILELGAAGDELNETASILGTKVDEVSSSIEQMVRSVKQVSASSDGLGDAAAETSASMEEMASAMRAVDTTAEMTADLSRNVVGSAESGQEKVSQTIAGMQDISDATDRAEGVIRGLGARAKEIGAILDVIDDVADETNLLALNAAIIAAQAGDQGRAFSVVADEIKDLADRVLSSTKEIGGLIRSVQEESQNAVGAIEDGSKSVASGVELSAEAGLSLEEITRSSRESGQHIGEIVSAVREQTKAASHVVSLMDNVREGVSQIAAASAEQNRGNEVVYRSSVTMREVAQQVRRTTEEQSRGFGRIRESVEGVREAVEKINGSLHEQSSACNQVGEFLEQVFEKTRSNEDAAQSMGESIRGLVSQAEALREDVAKFRI